MIKKVYPCNNFIFMCVDSENKMCFYDASNVLFLLLTTITISNTLDTPVLSDFQIFFLQFYILLCFQLGISNNWTPTISSVWIREGLKQNKTKNIYSWSNIYKYKVSKKKNTAVACSYSRATAVFLLGHLVGVYIIVNLCLKNLQRTNRQENNLVKISDVKIATKGLLCPFSQFNNFQLPHLDSI